MESDNDVLITVNNIRLEKKKYYFLLEPVTLLIFFGISLSENVFQTHLLQQTCINVFNFNITFCHKLGTEEIESEISKEINFLTQPYVAKIFMAKTILESILPAFVNLFIGPWSDKYGRKSVILGCLTGYLLGYTVIAVITLLSLYYTIHPWYYIIGSIPISLTGGMSCLISSLYCYIVDVCCKEDLAFRNLINYAAIYFGSFFGNLLSSYLLSNLRPLYIFVTSTNIVFIALIYITFWINEDIETNDKNKMEIVLELFKFSLVKDMFQISLQRRENYDRLLIWLLILSLIISVFISKGEDTVMYLFVVQKFSWTIKEFGRYCAIKIAFSTVGSVVGVYLLQKIFKLSVISLVLLGLSSAILNAIVKATAVYTWHMYLAIILGMLQHIPGPMNRTLLSNIIPKHDLGKIISFTVTLELISGLGAAPLYTFIYSATLHVYPGVFNFISAALNFFSYIFLIFVYYIEFKEPTRLLFISQ